MGSRHRNSSRNTSTIPYGWILFALASIWLIFSSIVKKSPIDTIFDSVSNVIGDSSHVTLAYNELLLKQVQKDSTISQLTTELEKCKNESPFRQGIIEIQDNFVNMRSKPSLNSSIVMKVPNSSKVDVLFFDTNEYLLDGKTGVWYKIKYADQEGFIWGNYVRLLEE